MKISIMVYSLNELQKEGKMDLFGFLESVKYRYGLNAVDINVGIPTDVLVSTEADYLKKVKDGLAERELVLANLCVDLTAWQPDVDVRERHYHGALTCLQAAETLGAKTVRIDIGGRSPEMTAEQFHWVVKRYKEYAQRAYDNGYKVGPENHYGPAVVPENMKRIHEAVDCPAYGVLLHIGRWVEGQSEEGDRLVAPWTFHTHIDSSVVKTCLAEKMMILRDAGYDGYWGLECVYTENPYTKVAIDVAKVRDVLDQWRLEAMR
jgi:sugar phosphate isomerase/epimerase